MRTTVNRLSDRLLRMVVPATAAQAKYCADCVLEGPCANPNYRQIYCFNYQTGWQHIGCYYPPNVCP